MSKTIEREAIKKFGNVYTKYKEAEWLFPCPKCVKHNDDNLHVNTILGVYHCFHCNFKGRLYSKKSLSDVIDKSDRVYYENSDYNEYLIPFVKQELTIEQKDALYKRGLTDDDIKFYNITGGKRIQIPNYVIGSLTDIVCAWEYRKDRVTKHNPKYLYSNDIKKNNVLFNIHNIKCGENIILCEGIFNAITAGTNAVASYGCHLSDRQLDLLLSKKPRKIIIAYDSDLPGVQGSKDAIKKLYNKKYKGDVEYILLPKGIDINDMGKKEFYKFYEKERVPLHINTQYEFSLKIPELLFSAH